IPSPGHRLRYIDGWRCQDHSSRTVFVGIPDRPNAIAPVACGAYSTVLSRQGVAGTWSSGPWRVVSNRARQDAMVESATERPLSEATAPFPSPASAPAPTARPVLEMDHVSKRFGATQALDEVSLTLYPGEI